MAKQHYGIRASIDRSWLDAEINISGGGWQLKAMPIKQVFFYLGAGLALIWAISATWIKNSGPFFITAFVLWGLFAMFYLGALTKTKQLRVLTIPPLISYLPSTARNVITRRSSNPTGFYSLVNIDHIEDDGVIHFSDGSFGQTYAVVGSASYLLFDEDRFEILNRVDAYWRKVDATCEHIFITTKEPQRIYRQVAALEERNRNLEIRDPDLLALQNESFGILQEHVGGKFTSIHQYLILKGKTADSLKRGHNILQAEVEGSSKMIRDAALLNGAETITMFKTFYQGTEEDPLAVPLTDVKRTDLLAA